MTCRIGANGQVVIPKSIRDQVNLHPGDEVDFELPLDPLSRLALPVVRSQMAAMFRFRQKRTAKLLALIR